MTNPVYIDAHADFAQASATLIASKINSCIIDRDECILGLSGGGTPKPVYELLGKEQIDWQKVKIFLTDERYISPGHMESNERMVRQTLLAHAKIPGQNICFPDTTLPMGECLGNYVHGLKEQWSEHLADVIILGMGIDGHITSLFPPVAPDLMDDTRLVAHTTTDQFAVHDRITLTLNPIAAASSHVFLLKGEDKKRLWEEMIASGEDESRWPAKRILEQPDVTVVFG